MSDPINELAQLIRTVDGNHDLGAGALAEKLIERGVTYTPPVSQITPDYLGIKAESLAELVRLGTYPGALDELVRRALTSPLRPVHEQPWPDAAPRWYSQDERMPGKDTWVNVALTDGRVTTMKYSPASKPQHNPEKCWKVHGLRYARAEIAFWAYLPPHPDRRTP